MNANERFEYMAELFYKQTGYLAPGKDSAAGVGVTNREKAESAWGEWTENFYSDLFVKLVN